jgi:hypothetical protein
MGIEVVGVGIEVVVLVERDLGIYSVVVVGVV